MQSLGSLEAEVYKLDGGLLPRSTRHTRCCRNLRQSCSGIRSRSCLCLRLVCAGLGMRRRSIQVGAAFHLLAAGRLGSAPMGASCQSQPRHSVIVIHGAGQARSGLLADTCIRTCERQRGQPNQRIGGGGAVLGEAAGIARDQAGCQPATARGACSRAGERNGGQAGWCGHRRASCQVHKHVGC